MIFILKIILMFKSNDLHGKEKNNTSPPIPLTGIGGLVLRYLADSNRRKRFCRPLPSHSVKVPGRC